MENTGIDTPAGLRERAARVHCHAVAFLRDADFSQRLSAYAAELERRAVALEAGKTPQPDGTPS